MSELSGRAEQIAALLVAHDTGAAVEQHDVNGRQGAVDFLLTWADGDAGALEVTMITESQSVAWQGLAMRDGWRWPSPTSWEFRPNDVSFPYKRTKQAALRAVALCDEWRVDDPSELPEHILRREHEVAQFIASDVGRLRRSPFSSGISLFQAVSVEFIDATPADFSLVVESWLDRPHIGPHLQKLACVQGVARRLLFLVVVSEALPARFFTDDFEAPKAAPRGYEEVDSLFVWSDFWHRYLACRNGRWERNRFPPQSAAVMGAGSG